MLYICSWEAERAPAPEPASRESVLLTPHEWYAPQGKSVVDWGLVPETEAQDDGTPPQIRIGAKKLNERKLNKH